MDNNYFLTNFRLVLGICLIIDLVFFKIIPLEFYYDYESSLFNIDFIKNLGSSYFSIFIYLDKDYKLYAYIIIYFLICVMYAISIYPTISSIFLFFLVWNWSQRGVFLYSGWDTYFLVLIFCSFLFDYTNKFRKLNKLAHIALIAQIGLLYFSAGIVKNGVSWKEGHAIQYVLNDYILSRNPYYRFGENTCFLSFGTYLVVLFELSMPILLIFHSKHKIIRWIIAIGILSFHAITTFFLHIGMFLLCGISVFFYLIPIKHKFSAILINNSKRDLNIPKTKYVFTVLFLCILSVNFLLNILDSKKHQRVNPIFNKNPFVQKWGMFGGDISPNQGYIDIIATNNSDTTYLYNNTAFTAPKFYNKRILMPYFLEFIRKNRKSRELLTPLYKKWLLYEIERSKDTYSHYCIRYVSPNEKKITKLISTE